MTSKQLVLITLIVVVILTGIFVITTVPVLAGQPQLVAPTAVCTVPPKPTQVPPTAVPPTSVPPTEVQPTQVPPATSTNTGGESTVVPPTSTTVPVATNTSAAPGSTPIPPTNVPPTNSPGGVSATTVPATKVPPSGVELPSLGGGVSSRWTPIHVSSSVCVDWLVYHTNQTGDWEIFRLGNTATVSNNISVNLSKGIGQGIDDIGPSLSPDRAWITFTSNRDGNWEIYVASTDGQSQRRMTFHNATSIDPVWSPNGVNIAYTSNYQGNLDLYMFNVQTGHETRLTTGSSVNNNAAWSPDSQSIAYEVVKNGRSQIYEANVATHKTTLLSDGQGSDVNPTYSPTGKQIAFISSRNSIETTLYVMNRDGSKAQAISQTGLSALNHSWSPDGTLIAYQAQKGSDLGVYVYQFATGKTRRVTDTQSANYAPTWFCHGNTLVFTSDVNGNPNLFSVAALPIDAASIDVANEATQLTTNKLADQYAAASPFEEDASSFGPQNALELPTLGGEADNNNDKTCGKAVPVDVTGGGVGFPVISTNNCSK